MKLLLRVWLWLLLLIMAGALGMLALVFVQALMQGFLPFLHLVFFS